MSHFQIPHEQTLASLTLPSSASPLSSRHSKASPFVHVKPSSFIFKDIKKNKD